MLKSVGLVARFDKKSALKLAEDLTEYLIKKGLEVQVEDTLAEKVSIKGKTVSLEKMKTDLIVTIGGDGTILRTCISIPKPEPPILAINMGVRGFLTEVEPKQAFNAVDKCLRGEFTIERCMKLSITANGEKFPEALNEVLVSADEPAKLLYTKVLKDEKLILNMQADGVMIATQTGSTGYSLSAGGPVLDPDLDAFVLTPVCPLGIFHPIVFPANSSLTVSVVKPKKTLVVVDGHYRKTLSGKTVSIKVTRSNNETRFVRFKENFYHRLKSRLLFKGS
ncbi:MAG: NAD(+)/NADH kinase [Candidatus Bathyarchaeales archaeon]